MRTYANSRTNARATTFARDAVHLEFRGRDAKAIEQGDFVDRVPDQVPRRHTEADAVGALASPQRSLNTSAVAFPR